MSTARATAGRLLKLRGALAPLALAALLASGCAGAAGRESAPAPTLAASVGPPPFRFFSPESIWNRTVEGRQEADPHSSELVEGLAGQIAGEQARGGGPGIDTTSYSVPLYTVAANAPGVPVRLSAPRPAPALASAFSAVPLPAAARPAPGSDKHLLVWQPTRQRLWEFWRLQHGQDGWQAAWGGAIRGVSASNGAYGRRAWPGASGAWGASASGLSLAGGLITLEDLRDGVINHALAMSIPDVRAGVFAVPATRSDGLSHESATLPEGAHLRLDPALELTALHLPGLTMMLALAAQRYGIVIRDRAAHVTFYGEDPGPTGSDPYRGAGGYFAGQTPAQLLADFPWASLQVLRMRLRRERTRAG